MESIQRSIVFSLLFCLLISNTMLAQKTPIFKSFDLGVDYLKLPTFAFKNETKWEGITALNFGFGLSIDGEYGYAQKTPNHMIDNGSYTFEGNYYRIGLGYNSEIGDKATIGLGVRYAESKFKDQVEYTIKSEVFYDYQDKFSRSDLSARWLEVVLRSEAGMKKIKNVKLGLFIRVKFLDPITQPQEDYLQIRAIPGYGLANNNKTLAANLYIKYSIPLSRSN